MTRILLAAGATLIIFDVFVLDASLWFLFLLIPFALVLGLCRYLDHLYESDYGLMDYEEDDDFPG